MAIDDLNPNWTDALFGGKEESHLHGRKDSSIQQGTFLEIYHLKSKRSIKFKAFLTEFSDSFNCNFNKEAAYGRPDPFFVYQNTTRTMNLGWSLPAHDLDEAMMNLKKCSFFASMLYPVYEPVGGATGTTALSGSPIVKIKFANLIQSTKITGGSAEHSGLAGAVNNFTFNPVVSEGFFVLNNPEGPNELFPKVIQISCTFDVIHEHPLGWLEADDPESSTFAHGGGMANFPYGIENKDTAALAAKRAANALVPETEIIVKTDVVDDGSAPEPETRSHVTPKVNNLGGTPATAVAKVDSDEPAAAVDPPKPAAKKPKSNWTKAKAAQLKAAQARQKREMKAGRGGKFGKQATINEIKRLKKERSKRGKGVSRHGI